MFLLCQLSVDDDDDNYLEENDKKVTEEGDEYMKVLTAYRYIPFFTYPNKMAQIPHTKMPATYINLHPILDIYKEIITRR